jgi:ring-1,2-phenylacetyl-CoA epoxidase subunit PaaC
MSESSSASTVSPAHDEPLVALVATLADNKCWLGRRYAEWCTAAPSLESAVAAAAMAQDEIGHARSFYPVLREVAGESPQFEPETRTEWVNAPFLDSPFASWTDFVAANTIFDTSLSVLLEAAAVSSFGPLAQRARRILEEEPLHWLHGEGWTRRLSGRGDAVRSALAASFGGVGPQSLAILDVALPALVERQILASDASALRDGLRERVNPLLAECGLPAL